MSLLAVILKKAFFVIALLAAIFVLGSIILSSSRGESDYGLFAHFTVSGFIRLGAWIGLIIVVPFLLKKIFSKRRQISDYQYSVCLPYRSFLI
jgi:hypothetical protein